MTRPLPVLRRLSVVMLFGVLAAGCNSSSSSSPSPPSFSTDSGADAAFESGGPQSDGSPGFDAGFDASYDANNVGPDANGNDAGWYDAGWYDAGWYDAGWYDGPSFDAPAGTVTVSPATLDFGTVILNEPSTKSVTVKNAGSVTFTLIDANVTGSDFSVAASGLPTSLAPGATISLSVTFNPTASGPLSGDVTFDTDFAGSADLPLSGTGIHAVILNWNASTSPNVVGYNVYRGLISGGPYTKINTSLVPVTTYTDTTVQKCTTYYYVTTAVNSSGLESTYSNETTAVVPCT